jgi:TetR/AcrR family transcriptional regulator, tetracycline repressor protein
VNIMSRTAAQDREPLTRDRIVDAALGIMDDEGLESVTMRRVGRELGVEAMSLYNHVKGKEDLHDAITERVMGTFRLPAQADDWREDARRTAQEWRRVLRLHPNVMRLMAERTKPMTNVESFRPMDHAIEVLRRAGLSDRDTVQAFHAFGGYIFGFVLLEQGMMLGQPDEEEHRRGHEELGRLLGNGELPSLAAMIPHFIDCSSEEQFDFGLEMLIAGVAERAAGRRA